jgi:hypothetical protein
MLLQKTVTCWHYSAWRQFTFRYEPLRKGGIAPDEHPAVKEDRWLAETPTPTEKRYRKHGELCALLLAYLDAHGPSTVKQIMTGLNEDSAARVSSTLIRNPELFVMLSYEYIPTTRGTSRANVWGLHGHRR